MTLIPHYLSSPLTLVAAACLTTNVYAQVGSDAPLEFDANFLRAAPGQATATAAQFSRPNAVLAGTYTVDILINERAVGREKVRFVPAADATAPAQMCVSRNLLERIALDLKQEPYAAALQAQSAAGADDCTLKAADLAPLRFDFDIGAFELRVHAPQAALLRVPAGTVDMARWSEGVNASFLRYRANYYSSHQTGAPSRENSDLGLEFGANLGRWRLRHSGFYSAGQGVQDGYKAYQTSLQTDLPAWRSQLILGDLYTGSELLDGIPLRGVKLASDERMLPYSQRGFAPEVRGMARSNARLEISQRGNVVYSSTVAAGAFVVDDLYAASYGGDLEVRLTEEDGTSQSWTVPYAQVNQQLLRRGQTRFEVAVGELRFAVQDDKSSALHLNWQRGLSNTATASAGLQAADHYQALALGLGLNTSVGALGLDVTQAHTQLPGGVDRSGKSVRLQYSRYVPTTGSNFILAGYRYSSEGFYRMREAYDAWQTTMGGLPPGSIGAVYRMRNQLQASLSQELPTGWGNVWLVGSRRQYWQANAQENEWQLGYTNQMGVVSYNFGVQQTRSRQVERNQKRLFLSASMPFGDSPKRPYLTSSISHSDGHTDGTIGISGVAGEQNEWSYAVNALSAKGQGNANANVGYSGSSALLNASVGVGPSSRQYSLGASGALVAHSGGIVASNSLGDSFAIVDAPLAFGARVQGGVNMQLDRRGQGIVPWLTPYTPNTVAIETEGMPLDVELDYTSTEVVPRAGSIMRVRFDGHVTGRSALLVLSLPNGQAVPLGAQVQVLDSTNPKAGGTVAQGGNAYVRDLPDRGQLLLRWGQTAGETCRVNYTLPVAAAANSPAAAIARIPLLCQPRL